MNWKYFEYEHLRHEKLKRVSKKFHDLAQELADEVPASEEAEAGMRKLLEAKDCFVRAELQRQWDDPT